ncbi:hypothetical protein Asppvi_005480 [Aspergillus pseudoviridinutans]|uniref:Uncharacterized protein n=1 Tax=Aspergillus pseudoviridinutans TaxID=1517512 RepID=A0A9P3EV99_9EURO|nr:uncharacterized protein Asppvi_005480 [Aspergillus pseudoviridinutans]GIJ86590.1 hypothetical protein Asppvi_005480 [Aspergillus pseudoviridinutans]
MHFTTTTLAFGFLSLVIAAPGPMSTDPGFHPGSTTSACYCCPATAALTTGNCGRAAEDGRCVTGDVLICCDQREQACSTLATLTVDGRSGALKLGGLLNQIVDGLLG